VSTTRLAVTGTVNPEPTIIHVSSSGADRQSVEQNKAITAIVYTTTNSATISPGSSSFPSGVTGAPSGTPSGTSYTISGTPTATGTFGYSLTASMNGCTSAAAVGTITVVKPAQRFTISTGGPNTAYTTTTWKIGTGSSAQTWSDRIVLAVCSYSDEFAGNDYLSAKYKVYNGRYYYSAACAYENRSTFCPIGENWRLPTSADVDTLMLSLGGSYVSRGLTLLDAWGAGGFAMFSNMESVENIGYYWADGAWSTYVVPAYRWMDDDADNFNMNTWLGLQIRCVK
jgi:hypothetical protein